jgi:hypothetical protein
MGQKHLLRGIAKSREVWLDKEYLNPKYSQLIVNHSHDGFCWGYEGSGPAQLAASILLKINGKIDGYQDFKRKIISKLPIDEDFEIEFEL